MLSLEVIKKLSKYDGLVAEVERLENLVKTHKNNYTEIAKEYLDTSRQVGELKQEISQQSDIINAYREDVERLEQEISQHIKWNKEHVKARVELSKRLRG